jgi:hypothetical protein
MALLRVLLAVPVVVLPAAKHIVSPFFLSSLNRDDGGLSVLCGVDLPLAVYLGSALAGIPRTVAQECIRTNCLDESYADAVQETLNVTSSLFNVKGAPHVRLQKFAQQGTPGYAELAAQGAQGRRRADLTVQIERYGTGALTFITFETIAQK